MLYVILKLTDLGEVSDVIAFSEKDEAYLYVALCEYFNITYLMVNTPLNCATEFMYDTIASLPQDIQVKLFREAKKFAGEYLN